MDLWAMLGLSRGAAAFVPVVVLAVAALVVGRLLRRSGRTDRVWVDLSGRR